jgi:hypothetical protein
MRPKISMWSDYGAPAQKHWRSPYRRNAQSSIGPKILLAAVVVVAGVIGISGIYPQIIDSGWMQDPAAHSQRVAHSDAAATDAAAVPRRSGIVAAIPLPPRRTALTTGEAAVTTARAAAPVPTPASASAAAPAASGADSRTSIAVAEPAPAAEAAPVLAIADVPDAQAKVDAPTDPAPAAAAAAKPAQRVARAPVKKRVVRAEHHRGYSGAYAQWGGGWGGSSGWGSPFRC